MTGVSNRLSPRVQPQPPFPCNCELESLTSSTFPSNEEVATWKRLSGEERRNQEKGRRRELKVTRTCLQTRAVGVTVLVTALVEFAVTPERPSAGTLFGTSSDLSKEAEPRPAHPPHTINRIPYVHQTVKTFVLWRLRWRHLVGRSERVGLRGCEGISPTYTRYTPLTGRVQRAEQHSARLLDTAAPRVGGWK